MVRMRYGSPVGKFGEQTRSPNIAKCIGEWLGVFGEPICSPNVPNALP